MRSLQPYIAVGAVAKSALVDDPLPYGIERNRHVLTTLMGYLREQGLTERTLSLDEIFHAGMLQL